MKKSFFQNIIFVLLIIVTLIYLSFQTATQTYVFNAKLAYEHVKILSSEEYEGRKPSTQGNIKALDYAEKILIEEGYDVIRQPFNALIPFIDSDPVFEITDDNGNIINKLMHRKDFKEALGGYSSNGEMTSKFLIDGKSVYDIKGKIYNDSIVVINNDYRGYAEQDTYYIKAKVKALLIPSSDKNVMRASGFPGYDKDKYINKKDKIVKIYITYDTYNLLKSKCEQVEENLLQSKNAKIHLSMPLSFKIVKTENLIAYLKGSNLSNKSTDKNYLGFSAHIDHLGKDPNGLYFPGALDNASGSAFTLEMANVLKNYKDRLTVEPLIILFNAEENGLCGSYYFVHNPLIDLSKLQLINNDMVAAIQPVSYNLMFYQGNKPNHPAKDFAIKIRSFGSQNNFYFYLDNISGDTDHYYFNEKNYSAVSVNQFPEDYYHTYLDNASQVSEAEFEYFGQFMEKFILANYTLKTQSLYNIFIIFLLIAFSLKFKLNTQNT